MKPDKSSNLGQLASYAVALAATPLPGEGQRRSKKVDRRPKWNGKTYKTRPKANR